ncbi:hypothetical protein ZEAMMB73_Zm00001d006426 [Zea mays]|uniref:Uncharacterized protein n=1 Tax=Zea mays TaxID=4577 RepID=A0A1D6EW39_MAIZE|nr:hypothetical protein ZEAMMB73_Zm00001d006426 [Zea mays]
MIDSLMIPILNNSGMSTSECILLREDVEHNVYVAILNVVSVSHHTKMELSYLLSLADITSTGVVLPHDAQTKGSFRNHTCTCQII